MTFTFSFWLFIRERSVHILAGLAFVLAFCGSTLLGQAQQSPQTDPKAPVVTKIEPPSWWSNLTPEVMLLLSGRYLEATHVVCNLPSVLVERTQATAGGDYLFVWIKIGPETKSGTAVCRITTPTGTTSFELPLATRAIKLGKFQGLSQDDVIYLIMPDRFANGDPTNDEPVDARGTHDRTNARAYHGGDLRGIREHLPYLKDLGVTTLWLTPILKNGAAQDYHGYGAVDLYAVDPHLGTIQDYQELVAEAHKQGMKIFLTLCQITSGRNIRGLLCRRCPNGSTEPRSITWIRPQVSAARFTERRTNRQFPMTLSKRLPIRTHRPACRGI